MIANKFSYLCSVLLPPFHIYKKNSMSTYLHRQQQLLTQYVYMFLILNTESESRGGKKKSKKNV